jgi:heme exporter protein D
MAEFFAMGGYAAYVWPAYGLSALALAALIAISLLESRRAAAQLRALDNDKSADPGAGTQS